MKRNHLSLLVFGAVVAFALSLSTTGCGSGNNGGGCGSSCGVALPTGTFSASPTSITGGSSTTLSWTSANATSASIDNGVGSVTPVSGGSAKVSPATTTTYTLTLTGSGGSVTYQAAVTVTSAGNALILYYTGGNGALSVVESNGTNPTQIVSSGVFDPAWFANHQSFIAVDSVGANEFHIFTTSGTAASTQLQSNISLAPIVGPGLPTPSPDGKTIVFVGFSSATYGHQGIYTVKSDGTGLTTTPLYQDPNSGGVALGQPRWSHDGNYIVHNRVDASGHSEIWVMNADGTNARQVTNIPGTNNSDPAFSLDDGTIFFDACAPGNATCQIWKIASAGTANTETLVVNNALGPVPSPDGKSLVYVGFTYGETTVPLFVSDVNGNNPQQIVSNGYDPSW
jgi:Tol biopolymer transport system component